MKKLLCLLMAMIFVLGLCACGNNDTQTETPSEEITTVPTEDEVITDSADDDTTLDDGKVEYTVTVVDELGNPIPGLKKVQICDDKGCSFIFLTDGKGSDRKEESNYHLILELPEGYEYTTEEQEFYFDEAYNCLIVLKAVE